MDFNVNTPTRREECTPDVAITGNYVNCIFLLLKRKGLFFLGIETLLLLKNEVVGVFLFDCSLLYPQIAQ